MMIAKNEYFEWVQNCHKLLLAYSINLDQCDVVY